MSVGLLTLVALTGTAVWAGTALVRRYARHALLDVPNARSSHSTPTPRGGGLAIVCGLLPALIVAWSRGWIPHPYVFAVVGGGGMTAAIGWLDDHRALPPSVRLVAHFSAAVWALYWIGVPSELRAGDLLLPLGPAAPVLMAVLIVWLLNLYNFMDGIDGLAGSEAVTVGGGAALLGGLLAAPHITAATLLIAGATAGFLVWNWAPARIFLGDVGSGFLGFTLAVTAIYSELTGGPSLLLWLMLLGVFITDATLTLIRRMVRRERVFSAHRSHAYQRAVQSGCSHPRVASGVALINVALVGLAILGQTSGAHLSVLAAAGLFLVWIYARIERRQPM